jgi:hypothetical protein
MTKPNGAGGVSKYFAEMRRMSNLLLDIYTPMETQEWLLANNKLLPDGMSPAQLIACGRTHEVEQLINEIRDGAFL